MGSHQHYYLYNELARFYDDFYSTKKYEEEVAFAWEILHEIYNCKTDSLLDVGCGTGSHLIHFAKYFKRVYGLDPSAPMIEIAKTKGVANSDFFVSTIQDFSCEITFDVITSFNSAMNYMQSCDDLCIAFERVFSLLVSKGVALVQLHDCVDKDFLFAKIVTNGNDRLVVVGDWTGKNKYGPHAIDFFYHLWSNGNWTVYHDAHQEYLFPKHEILAAMRHAGFIDSRIIETQGTEKSPFPTAEFICIATKP